MPEVVVAAFVVEALADDEVVIVRVPAAERRDPGFARRLAAFVARDAAPAARLRRRDELIRRMAEEFYTGSPRARARALLADVRHYETTRWRFDRGCTCCPPEIEGTVQEMIWHLLKEAQQFPRLRQLQNILPMR
jgi:hypothetical protein